MGPLMQVCGWAVLLLLTVRSRLVEAVRPRLVARSLLRSESSWALLHRAWTPEYFKPDEAFQPKLSKFLLVGPHPVQQEDHLKKLPTTPPHFEFDSLGKVLKVDVDVDVDCQEIQIYCERALIEIRAWYDDCSYSDFADAKFILGSAADLIGEEVLSVSEFEDQDKIDAFYPGDEYEMSDDSEFWLYVLQLASGKTVHIMGCFRSNGYYAGGCNMEVTRIDAALGAAGIAKNVDGTIAWVKPRSAIARLIFVIGLPGSGKTTYCKENLDPKVFHILDDSCSDPDHRLLLEAMMNNGYCVAFGDPRLCELKRFRSIVSLALSLVVSPAQIAVVYFDNDKDKCAVNVDACASYREGQDEEDRVRFLADIDGFHPRYHETIAFIESPSLDARVLRHRVQVYESTPL